MSMIHKNAFAIILGLHVAIAATSGWADSRFVPPASQPQGHVSDLAHVELFGEITASDIKRVAKHLEIVRSLDPSKRTVPVFLSSPGGDLLAAMEIGKILRKSHAWTIVSNNMECSSACIFILASGVQRDAFNGAMLGLHRPRFDQTMFANLDADKAQVLYNTLIRRCRIYLREMGVSDQLLDDMLRTESRKITYQDRDYAERVSLIGDDPAFQEWNRAKRIEEEGEDIIRAQEYQVDCYNSGTDHDICDNRFREMLKRIGNKP